jgi:hypothetical protein
MVKILLYLSVDTLSDSFKSKTYAGKSTLDDSVLNNKLRTLLLVFLKALKKSVFAPVLFRSCALTISFLCLVLTEIAHF